MSPLKLVLVVGGILVSTFVAAVGFIQWNVEHSVNSINSRIESLENSVDSQIVNLGSQLQALNEDVDQVDDKVAVVDTSVALVDRDSERVKDDVVEVIDDVVEVKNEVEKISSDLDETSGKIDAIKTALAVAFKDNSEVKILLEDARLSLELPLDFFTEIPEAAALRVEPAKKETTTTAASPTSSIAEQCQKNSKPSLDCYTHFLKRFEEWHSSPTQ
ncbi:MAG: hypothetical protein ACPGSC_01705 [Granulosicoccaceae bacterium]